MALKVTVTNKDFPDDHEFDIRGLGLFINGKSREVSEEEEASYVSQVGQSVKDSTAGIEYVKVEGTASVKVEDVVVEVSDTTEHATKEEPVEATEDKGGES